MGLHGVSQFLRNKYPQTLHKEHISLFAHQRVFVDITGYIYRYVCIFGSESTKWLDAFFFLLLSFRRNGVYVIPVFDGQAPIEKLNEQTDRREKRAKIRERTRELEELLKKYQNGDRSDDVFQTLKKEVTGLEKKGGKAPRLLRQPSAAINVLTKEDIEGIEKVIKTWKIQTSSLTEDDNKFLRELLDATGISWLQAPEESEGYCCFLVKKGLGSAVISPDTDCIAHRADVIINDFDPVSGEITFINIGELMESMQLTEDQLVDFGILVGCDYNPGSRENKIGPVTAVKALREFGCIENIPNLKNTECLKIDVCRRLFNLNYDISNLIVKAGKTNREQLELLLQKKPTLNRYQLEELIEINNRKVKIIIDEE